LDYRLDFSSAGFGRDQGRPREFKDSMRKLNTRKRIVGKIVDGFLRILFVLFAVRSMGKRVPIKDLLPKSILVLDFYLIGDIVMAVPALTALRGKYPHSRIALVGGPWASELLSKQNLVDEFIAFRCPWTTFDYSFSNILAMMGVLRLLRHDRWDLGIELRGDLRALLFLFFSKAKRRISYDFTGGDYLLTDVAVEDKSLTHIVDHQLHLVNQLGCPIDKREPTLNVDIRAFNEARTTLGINEYDNRVVLGIHAGASNPLRLWHPERFAEIADRFMETDNTLVVFFIGPNDSATVEAIISRMKRKPRVLAPPLEAFPAFLGNCTVLLGLDSGAVHVAAAVGVPTVVLFGPQDPALTKPLSSISQTVIKEGFACRPCDQKVCVRPTDTCMDGIDVETVYRKVFEIAHSNKAATIASDRERMNRKPRRL
jgi:lipopolysaccharide heptosyltransferase II